MENITSESVDNDVVVRRLYAQGTWKLESVAHFGGDETGVADMCLLLDTEGKPFIPGPSIAGASRNFLARQRLDWAQYSHEDGLAKEPPELKRFFGGAGKADTMSALIVADAHCKKAMTSIRDGVRINRQSGSAADNAKFDVEVVERGTEFELNLECIIRYGDNGDALTDLFLVFLQAFQRGDIRLGARTRRGYGHGKVKSWKVRDLQMNNSEDVRAWLCQNIWSCAQTPLVLRPLQSEESIFLALPEHRSECTLAPPLLQPDQRRYFQIEADFALRTSLLIRSSPAEPEAPDIVHLQSVGKPVVPGTSFAGAFRHRAALIANTLGWEPQKTPDYEDADAVCEMFGPIHKKKRDEEQEDRKAQQGNLWASRIWIEEKLVKNVESWWQHRVAIDRFTGGSLDGALFNEEPVYPMRLDDFAEEVSTPNLRLILTLEEPEDAEIGLLLLTLRDFWQGHAALGGETSNGRGTLRGLKASMKLKNAPASDTEVWEFSRKGSETGVRLKSPALADVEVWKFSHKDKCMALDKGNKAFLESCIKAAQDYSNRPNGSRRPKK